MTLAIHAGWDFGLDPIAFQVIDGSTVNFSFTSGQYSNVDISAIVSTYNPFTTFLQTELDAAALTSNYTVTFNVSTGKFTIDRTTAGNFELKGPAGATIADTPAGYLLGFTSNKSGANAYTSDVSVYHWISGAAGARSLVSDEYEPPGMAVGAWSDGGSHYAIGVTSGIKQSDFSLEFEPKAKIFAHSASASVPYTYQHFWGHVRADQPFAVIDDSEEVVYYLRPDGASFRPRRHTVDSDALWSLEFQCYVEGRAEAGGGFEVE